MKCQNFTKCSSNFLSTNISISSKYELDHDAQQQPQKHNNTVMKQLPKVKFHIKFHYKHTPAIRYLTFTSFHLLCQQSSEDNNISSEHKKGDRLRDEKKSFFRAFKAFFVSVCSVAPASLHIVGRRA